MPRVFQTATPGSFITCRQTSRTYPPGSLLFSAGELPTGAHILESGRVKLFGSTSRGKIIVTKIARAGELLGLNALILGKAYLLSAETTEPSRVSYAQREDLLAFLSRSPEAAWHLVEQLSANYYDAQRELRSLILAGNVTERFARLLVAWIEESDPNSGDEVWLELDLTHEQVSQMMGTSRETVSRIMSSLAKRGILVVSGHLLRIPSVSRLREVAKL